MAVAKVAVNTVSVQPRRAPNWAAEVGSVWFLKYTPATSYTTGGDPIDIVASLPGQVRGKPVLVQCVGNAATIGWQGTYDYTNKAIQLWNGTTEATSSTDYSAKVFDLVVYAP